MTMVFSDQSTLQEVCSTEKGAAVLKKHLPLFERYPNFGVCRNMTLRMMAEEHHMGLSPQVLGDILKDMEKPAYEILPGFKSRESLDSLERKRVEAGPGPFSGCQRQ